MKFTENGVVRTLGQQGLWMTAGAVKYSQSALDVEACSSATHAVVPEGNMDIPVALRLKLQNQMITEIETIAVRPGDYRLGSTTYASNTAAMISANTTVMWETVPSGQRNTRAELIAWIDKYFRMFPRGVCNTVSSCRRLENGGGSFNCTDGATCAAGQPTGTPAMTPRILLADPETGIGVGMTMFMGNTDMHMFKMYGWHGLRRARRPGWRHQLRLGVIAGERLRSKRSGRFDGTPWETARRACEKTPRTGSDSCSRPRTQSR